MNVSNLSNKEKSRSKILCELIILNQKNAQRADIFLIF